ncbi:hypothetical protein GCM10027290_53860 [Micromonospora sonneratiae]|uniref:Uncharacterized protein n=1 Tax=Micromonospora sonneratiae TaxID=1184706 RepID=A0ABW3YGZ1_9ACTN
MTCPDLPNIPPGTVLNLNSEDWYHPDEATGDSLHDIVMVVEKVHSDGATATAVSVWVTGHGIACGWPTSDTHPPCIELRVRVEAIRRAVTETAGTDG